MGIDGVDDVGFDGGDFVGGEFAFEDDDLGGVNRGAFLAGEDLHALGGGVGALVELAGKILDGEGGFVFARWRGSRKMSSTCGSERMWVAASSNSASLRPSMS